MYACPSCYEDLDDSINRGIETGLWRFRLKCECGDILIWERSRLRRLRYFGTTPVPAYAASPRADKFFS